MKPITLHLGLDVHKDSIVIAIAEPGPKGELRLFGTITNDLQALEKALNRIRKAHPGDKLEVVCGNGHQRWLLTECAEHDAIPPKISKELSRRQAGQSEEVRALSWKAQNRLHTRFTRLLARRLQRNKAKIAVARELCGFVWPVLRTQDCYKQPTSTSSRLILGRVIGQKEKTKTAFNKKALRTDTW